ncbi:MAG: 2,3,4,5-tetrahydropyridine-2,6-dicarboxylate N-succinyltransferase [Candidatus Kapabacteria bacterium]|nr:2,3,4,5-tetrahydropyridine-2,6-dicarboxylate N-succinyltransferase [Ignavibacteriota bacterium]MCW5884532.1 2,3,4,5-tetrahydropyridine-2,6-dicarboxylate N-succinyltransferase [Candidatus Kapabacteria bacterium]
MNNEVLIAQIEKLYNKQTELSQPQIEYLIKSFINSLNNGEIRAAEPDGNGNWTVNLWVKQGILLIFRYSSMVDMSLGSMKFFDKEALTLRDFTLDDGVRIVPGGSGIRSGAYIAPGVICMPPMYINIGSYVDKGSMIDSHALVGTCAQIGKNVHISAAAQVGGVLEPAGARPVIIEDNVMIGGNCGIYEGVMVRERAVLGSGVILTASTKVYDLVNETVITSTPDNPLVIPPSAVVVPGARTINSDFGKENGLSISTPVIVKYRDDKTDARTALNFDLR